MCTIKKNGNCRDDHDDDDFGSLNSTTYEDPLLVTKRIINRYNLKKYGLNINEQEYYEIVDELKKLNLLMQNVFSAINQIPGQVSAALADQLKTNTNNDGKGLSCFPKFSSGSSCVSQISDDIEILDLIKNDSFEALNIDNQKWYYGDDRNISEAKSANLMTDQVFEKSVFYQNAFYAHWAGKYAKQDAAKAADSSLNWLYSNKDDWESSSLAGQTKHDDGKLTMPHNDSHGPDINVWLK